MFEVDPKNIIVTAPKYKNLTGNAYVVSDDGTIILNAKDTSKSNMNKEQFEYRKNMVIRLVRRCITESKLNRDKSKQCLRQSLNINNNVSHFPFAVFTAAFVELIKNREIRPSSDDKLIASLYRIFAEFHDDVANDGDDKVKEKLNLEADRYHVLSTWSQLGKMLKGGTRRKKHAKKHTMKKRRTSHRSRK
jgi:hypothetical protein